MARALENPDRNFSADGDPEDSFESLRYALANSEPALPFNEAAQGPHRQAHQLTPFCHHAFALRCAVWPSSITP